MRIRISYCADSSEQERTHTVKKCSFVHEIIQHVEYPTPMTRVEKITEYDTAHLRKQLTPPVTTDAQLSRLATSRNAN